MSGHMTSTWLWTNLLHPFIMFLYFNDGGAPFGDGMFGALILVMIYSLIFSLPSLFLSLLAGYLITRMQTNVAIQFLVWVITAPLIVVLNVVLLAVVSGDGAFTFWDLGIAYPGIIAVLVVVLLRYQLFFKVCELQNISKQEKQEYEQEQ